MDEENLRALQEKYQESKTLEEQLEFINQQFQELKDFSQHLESLDKTEEKEMFASLGKGIFVKSELKGKDLFVDVGSGILVKKTPAETKEIIEKQLKTLGEFRVQVSERLEGLAIEMQSQMSSLENSDVGEK